MRVGRHRLWHAFLLLGALTFAGDAAQAKHGTKKTTKAEKSSKSLLQSKRKQARRDSARKVRRPQRKESRKQARKKISSAEVLKLPKKGRFEGGDLLPLPQPRPITGKSATPLSKGVVVRTVADAQKHNIQAGTNAPIYFLGHGFRSNQATAEHLANQLGAIVVVGKLTSERFFHADTALGVLPDGVTFYRGAFSKKTRKLLEYLYPGRVHEFSPKEAEQLATNGRLIRLGGKSGKAKNGSPVEHFGYFYTEGAFNKGFFKELAKKYPGSKVSTRKRNTAGVSFVEHILTYKSGEVTKSITFVPMPESQALLGSGSVSCTTLLTADGKGVIMVPPTHYEISAGHNPAEDAAVALGGVNKKLAAAEYVHQKARFELHGIHIHELAPSAKMPEQIYTRDTGYFFNVDKSGRAWDPLYSPAGGKPAFLAATLRHPAREPEVGAIINGFSLRKR